MPQHKCIAVAGYWPSCSTLPGDTIKLSVDDSNEAASRKFQENSTLRFHVDSSVWDVIHKEVMDWRDSSWTSMDLPDDRTCK